MAAALRRRLLLRRRLRRRRELAERRRHQRDPRPGAVALHDRADGRDHLGAVHPEPRRPGRLHALRGHVGAGLALASLPILLTAGTAPRLPDHQADDAACSSSASRRSAASAPSCSAASLPASSAWPRSSAPQKGLTRRGRSRPSSRRSTWAGWCSSIPIGWVSDRMDRRKLIMGLTAAGALLTLLGGLFSGALRGGAACSASSSAAWPTRSIR